jgi:threonine/homoserine/homoserine lactone efflux protein
MTQIIISGAVLGLTLAVLIGPSFFALLQTSVNKGFRIGMFLAIGIFFSDFTLVSLSFLGVSQIFSGEMARIIFGVVGGGILIVYGGYTFRKKVTEPVYTNKSDSEEEIFKDIKAPKPILYVLKGYFLNLINPFLLIFWVGVMSFVSTEYENKKLDIIIFFSSALIVVFSTDLLKCFVANQIKRFLKPKVLTFINHALGLFLIGFGVYLIVKTMWVFYYTG